jgi:uncharacterized protein (DUF983 family)
MNERPPAPPQAGPPVKRLAAIWHRRCPHCLRGPVFDGLISMRETCPVCGITYEREHGFFMTSIFFGYVLGFLALLPAIIILLALGATLVWYIIVPSLLLVALAPLLLRYSRVLWMHADELMDPRRTDEVPVAAESWSNPGRNA